MNERYCRVYWAVIDDPKFDGVREDMVHLGSWVLMLLAADMAWPASAFVPPAVPESSVAALQSCGLVDRLSGGRYRVHGLDAEREARSESARNAAAMRWHKSSNATALPPHDATALPPQPRADATALPPQPSALSKPMPSRVRAEQEQEQKTVARVARPPTDLQIATTWLTDHKAAKPAGWAASVLSEMVKVYGVDSIVALFEIAPPDVLTSQQYVTFIGRQLEPRRSNGAAKPSASRNAPGFDRNAAVTDA